jgi:DNA-binding transcriptional regulator LsrR (DeoR family)
VSRISELRFISRVAHMYYIEGLRQSAIAHRLHLSQATVSRLIKRAHREQIVRISLASPEGTFPEIENALRERYGLVEAVVADCSEDRPGAVMARIGEAAAFFLESTIRDGEIIGVSSWSPTILKMIDAIHPLRQAKARHVVQLLGGIGNPSVQKHATNLTTRLAQLTGAEPLLLNAPGVAARGRRGWCCSATAMCARRWTSTAT